MQEWIIAMLVVSALLILRDMAKTIFSDMKKSAATLVYDQHPQKEKMQRYARSFQKLADSFYGMPYRKDYLSGGELEELVEQLRERQCKTCPANHICWKQHSVQSYQRESTAFSVLWRKGTRRNSGWRRRSSQGSASTRASLRRKCRG